MQTYVVIDAMHTFSLAVDDKFSPA